MISEKLAIALEVTGVFPKLVNLHGGMTLGAAASKLGALVVQEVVINGVFVQGVTTPVGTGFAHGLALVAHVVYIVIVFVVV